MYLINENIGRPKAEAQDLTCEADKKSAEDEEVLIYGLTNKIVAVGSPFRYIVYMNFKESCWWCVDCGLMTKDRCLAILLKYFCSEDEDFEFKLLVNKLISPDEVPNEEIEAAVDRVIAQSFGALSDELKQDIIEQCSYRDLFRETPDSDLPGIWIDPCPRKVLDPVIRRLVGSMIQTMWQQNEEMQAEKRELMKYNCIDCAYVSAKLKEHAAEIIQAKGGQYDLLKDSPVEDNHDNDNMMSSIFNIILSDVHVMVIALKDNEAEQRSDLSGKTRNSIEQSGKELCIRAYCKTAERYTEKQYRIPFRMDDLALTSLDNLLRDEKILENAAAYSTDPNGADFHYSLVYLENFRGIDHITVSFDHMFEFSKSKMRVQLTKERTEGPPDNFYGDKVLSLTGFIGKNGAGKSSIVDFLRESFLRICSDLYSEKIKAYDGFVDIKPDRVKSYRLLEDSVNAAGKVCEGTRFFVIFYLNRRYYYLTNLLFEGTRLPDGEVRTERLKFANKTSALSDMDFDSACGETVCPYKIGELFPINNRNCKIVYFSQFLSPDGVADEERQLYGGDETAVRPIEDRQQGLRIGRIVMSQKRAKDEGIIDLSEEEFNCERKSIKPEVYINRFLTMQLLFYYSKQTALKKYFREDFRINDLEVVSQELEVMSRKREQQNLDAGIIHRGNAAFVRDLQGQALETVLKDERAFIRPFSSGQYSKFVLLSRLYWAIKGWKEFEEVFSERGFDEKRAYMEPLDWMVIRDEMIGLHIQDTDAGVLFFDEADTYYHPDWQREFVQDILEIANDKERKAPMQIIFTTNSPLMLSDLMREDTYLMKDYERTPLWRSTVEDRTRPHWHNPPVPTFAQNIHTLMAKPFFLDRTIGSFADERIELLISLMIDVSDIVEFCKDKDGRNKKYTKFIRDLEKNHPNIHDKTMAISKCRKAAGKKGETEQKELNRRSGIAEGNYVANKLMRFRNAADPAEETEPVKYRWALIILKKHIDLIGEGVLRKELIDMYNDFTARTEPYFKE